MRLGVFGGTFDPPHVGHLLTAVDAVEALTLDRLLFVPAAQQPLKVGCESAAPEHRLAMARLLAGDDPRFGVDPIEIDRAGLSYTVDTLGELTRRLPGAELFFLVGADALATFPRWREPRRVLELARLVVLRRASDDVELPAMMREAPHREPIVLASRRVDVSSTEVRARVRAGLSIRGFVPDAVAAYVAQARLYR
ncbi:MAG TPA: nicotinate-nucleotide adenylyltransferase [Gemmatimonadaceae bacterium]|nr:nicotinate-nucleotide adenylyltransferase [Gemmatimonadaceae bacterium]